MHKLNEILLQKNIVLKEIKDITPKTRKKIKVFLGVDIKNFYYLLVSLDTKSRFLQKNAKELLEFVLPLSEVKFQKNKKILFSKAPMCGKAKEFLKSMGWRVL
jgi:hypothetical protein